MEAARNCKGKYEPAPMQVFEEVFTECPISRLDAEACETIGILNAVEGGMGGGGFLPSVFMEETAYFHNVRRIVSSAKWKLEKLKDKRKKEK